METEDIFKDFWADENKFDSSEYPENSKYFDKTNKNFVGKFKDVAWSVPITEFFGLRSKCMRKLRKITKAAKQQ